jgi:glycosyltransferase involved in cell wall biosynthesis
MNESKISDGAVRGSIPGKDMSTEPLVSVVTPFYNTGDFLAECIESVLQQTYQNWEYVLVDNCSTDRSTEIAQQYARDYPAKIRVVRTESFLSQVQNYNFTLTCISPSSKYCKMVQADDWLFAECISRMVEMAETHPSVGVVAAYRLERNEVSLSGLPYSSKAVSGRDACRLYLLNETYLFGSPTSVLFRAQIIRSRVPFFEERYAPFEDGHVCFDLLGVWDFGFVHQVLTYSRWDNHGIMSRVLEFGPGPFLHLSMLVAHGRDFLTSKEYSRRLRQVERSYFLDLTMCACALRPKPKEFWDFHRQGLAAINYVFDWKKFLRWLPRALVEKIWRAFWRIVDADSLPSQSAG